MTAGDPASDRYPTLDPSLADKIAALPGVAGVDRVRGYDISYQGDVGDLGALPTPPAATISAKIRLPSGRSSRVVDAELRSGDNAVISDSFANKHHVRAGDFITLPLGQGASRFHVIDIFYDYGSEKGFIVVERSTLLRYLPDPASSSLAVWQ